MRRLIPAAAVLLLAALHAPAASPGPLDVLLAQVDVRTVAASDIALARALGVLGFAPAADPIERVDVERFIDVLVILEEASRIGVTADQAEVEQAWVAIVARVGSEARLQRWLAEHAIDRAWARRLVEADVVRNRFLAERFAAFVFTSDEDIAGALGPGPHDEATREQARERLTRAAAERAQTEWLADARRRATIRILLPETSSIPLPVPPP
jgi:GNAT superfamily N-acetyltransferase